MDVAASYEAFEGKESLLDEAVAMHLVRAGQFDLADSFCEEAKIHSSHSLKQEFSEMYQVVSALDRKDPSPALDWAQKNRDQLLRRGSALEFQLHQLKFLSLLICIDNNGELLPINSKSVFQAISYAKKELGKFSGRHLKDVQRLMCSILFNTRPSSKSFLHEVSKSTDSFSPYQDLLSPSLWTDVKAAFSHDYCALKGLSKEAPLQVAIDIGATAIPAMIKLRGLIDQRRRKMPKVEMWSIADELPIEIPIPKKYRYHSIFACPVSKEQTNEYTNPPMMLPCGHIISRESLLRLAKGGNKQSAAGMTASVGGITGPGGSTSTDTTSQTIPVDDVSQEDSGREPNRAIMIDPFVGVNQTSKIKCPYCPGESLVGQCLRVYF